MYLYGWKLTEIIIEIHKYIITMTTTDCFISNFIFRQHKLKNLYLYFLVLYHHGNHWLWFNLFYIKFLKFPLNWDNTCSYFELLFSFISPWQLLIHYIVPTPAKIYLQDTFISPWQPLNQFNNYQIQVIFR